MAIRPDRLLSIVKTIAVVVVVLAVGGLAGPVLTPLAQTDQPEVQDQDRRIVRIERDVRADVETDLDLDGVDFASLDLDLNEIAQKAQRLARQAVARLELGGRAQWRDDDAPLDPRLVEVFIRALDDSDAEVRAEAAAALGDYRVAAAVRPLISALDDTSAEVREEAADALGKIRNPDAVDALVGKLDDPDEDVREEVAEALGRMRDPRALDGLIGALGVARGDALEEIIEAVGEIGGARALDALLTLTDHPDVEVRRVVIDALGDGDWEQAEAAPSPSPNQTPSPR